MLDSKIQTLEKVGFQMRHFENRCLIQLGTKGWSTLLFFLRKKKIKTHQHVHYTGLHK